MSYITDIQAKFLELYPEGTFLFSSEVRADDKLRNIITSNQPIFVIDDQPLTTQTVINPNSMGVDSPRLRIYVLTKYDKANAQVNENNSERLDQHEQCVEPMKTVAVRVLAQYFRTGPNVSRNRGTDPTFNITDKYNLWSKMLYGVEVNVSNLTLRRIIDYCPTAPSTTNIDANDIISQGIDPEFIPQEGDTVSP